MTTTPTNSKAAKLLQMLADGKINDKEYKSYRGKVYGDLSGVEKHDLLEAETAARKRVAEEKKAKASKGDSNDLGTQVDKLLGEKPFEKKETKEEKAATKLEKAAESGDKAKVEEAAEEAIEEGADPDSVEALVAGITARLSGTAESDQVADTTRVKGTSTLFGGKASASPYMLDKDGNEVPLTADSKGNVNKDGKGTVQRNMTRGEARQAFLDASPEEKARIQQKLWEAGFYPDGSVPRPGVVSQADINAYTAALDDAARNDLALDKYLDDSVATGKQTGQAAKNRLGGSTPKQQYVPDPITVSNVETVKAAATTAFTEALGRNATESEMAAFTAAFRQQEIAEQQKMNDYGRQRFEYGQQMQVAQDAYAAKQEEALDPFSPMNQPAKGAAGKALQQAAAAPIDASANVVNVPGAPTAPGAPIIEQSASPAIAAAAFARAQNPEEALANDWLVRAMQMYQGLGATVTVNPVAL